MNPDRERALIELTRRTPFWVCLLVFGVLAADAGFRLADSIRLRKQLDEAQKAQTQNIGRLREALSQAPQIEAKLQALSFDVIEIAKTNANAAQIVRDFKIQWTPGPEAFLTPPALPPAIPARATPLPTSPAATVPAIPAPASATAVPATPPE